MFKVQNCLLLQEAAYSMNNDRAGRVTIGIALLGFNDLGR